MSTDEKHLGLDARELALPYAKHWDPVMRPLDAEARDALVRGPIARPLLPPLSECSALLEPRSDDVENGYATYASGEARIASRTPMPGVTPRMIDWWFGWHSDEPQRYRLWHPRAHVHAAWGTRPPPGSSGRARYVGQTSIVDEYVGSTLGRYAIRFVAPRELGLGSPLLDGPERATAICARVGYADLPLDAGWLVHVVLRDALGSHMRSRFWIGGPHGAVRGAGSLGALAGRTIGLAVRPSEREARALLVHCAEEMAHLATFLPALWADHHAHGARATAI